MGKAPPHLIAEFRAKGITISKFDAARSQLSTAIGLWFADSDPVSIHALAYAAYEIVHAVSKKRDRFRRDLLFDTLVIKDEYRKEFNLFVKQHANFFKHADRDVDVAIEFRPILSELFMLFTIVGIQLCGERPNDAESAFLMWLYFHRPELLTEKGREQFVQGIPVDQVDDIRAV